MENAGFVATIGCIAVLVLMLMRVPIAICLGSVSIVGSAWMIGWEPAIALLIDKPIRTVTNFEFSVIPMFILMGTLVSVSGMSRELFRAAHAWVGHLPGGLAVSTVLACGGFAAINGSSLASAATMTQVALPEMRRIGYNPGFASGVIAAGGTIGIMIPPSVMFILYAIITESDIASLFVAGILPGLLAISLYCVTVQVVYWFYPAWMPRAEKASWSERIASLKDIWAVFLLLFAVLGAIYGGLTTITEAAGFGVIGALVIGVARGRLSWGQIVTALIESLRTSAALFFILIGAFLFQSFLAYTQTPQAIGEFLTNLKIGPMGIILMIVVFYIIAGMFVDGIAVVLLTVPIFHAVVSGDPAMGGLGMSEIWFGVIVVTTVEIGLISPPIGMICFVMNKMVPDVGLSNIFKGVTPFIISDIVRLALLLMFPAISLYLVNAMGH
ncbi:MAG: TRAP transporter large permease [Hyphomicrobiales bacterium]|nr:TRAP transporter large permease [Hyphomicrobiales bacterium]